MYIKTSLKLMIENYDSSSYLLTARWGKNAFVFFDYFVKPCSILVILASRYLTGFAKSDRIIVHLL